MMVKGQGPKTRAHRRRSEAEKGSGPEFCSARNGPQGQGIILANALCVRGGLCDQNVMQHPGESAAGPHETACSEAEHERWTLKINKFLHSEADIDTSAVGDRLRTTSLANQCQLLEERARKASNIGQSLCPFAQFATNSARAFSSCRSSASFA